MKVGTHIILKDRHCNDGVLDFDFVVTDFKGGDAGILFRYFNENDYYILEFHKNKMELRHIVKGSATSVDVNEEWVTESDKWYSVRLEV